MPQKNKDLLDEILGKAADETIAELDGLEGIIYRAYRKDQPQLEQQLPPQRKSRQPKRRTTHYLSEDVYAELGFVKDKIAELFLDDHRHKISRSDVVNQALRIVLEEFDAKGLESPLVGKVIRAVKRKASQIKEEKCRKNEVQGSDDTIKTPRENS